MLCRKMFTETMVFEAQPPETHGMMQRAGDVQRKDTPRGPHTNTLSGADSCRLTNTIVIVHRQ
jgi:hypothetical protein